MASSALLLMQRSCALKTRNNARGTDRAGEPAANTMIWDRLPIPSREASFPCTKNSTLPRPLADSKAGCTSRCDGVGSCVILCPEEGTIEEDGTEEREAPSFPALAILPRMESHCSSRICILPRVVSRRSQCPLSPSLS